METLFQDVRYGIKLLWKDKGFAITAILTLALCIGANTAIFSVINTILLQPLPYDEAERITLLYNAYPNAGCDPCGASVPDFYDRMEQTDTFEILSMHSGADLTVGLEGETPERVQGLGVTPSFFRLLRVDAARGRTFTDEEGEVDADRTVLLTHAAWQQYFPADESAVGKELRINGNQFTVVGILDESFEFFSPDIRLYVPLSFTDQQKSLNGRHSNNWQMLGRLKPEASIELAQQQVDAINERNNELFPMFSQILTDAGFHTPVVVYQEFVVRDISNTLFTLWGGVGFVLLIGFVNIANLAIVRANRRATELATRMSLGAGRGRLARQLLTENVLLAAAGGGLGLLFGYWGLSLLRSLGLQDIPRGNEVTIDATVAMLALGVAALVGAALGFIPLAGVARGDLSSVFRAGGRTSTGGRGARIARRSLVAAQVGFALILLIGAGLLLTSFQQILAIDPGFEPDNVLTGRVTPRADRYPEIEDLRAFGQRALEALRGLPGVQTVGLAGGSVPFAGGFGRNAIFAEGYVPTPGESLQALYTGVADGAFFDALGFELVQGRFFDATDTQDSMRVIVVDEDIVNHYWAGQDPIGKRMFTPSDLENPTAPPADESQFLNIVGVVRRAKLEGMVGIDEPLGAIWFPLEQAQRRNIDFVIKAAVEPTALIEPMRRAIAEIDSELPVYNAGTMNEFIDDSLAIRRAPMVLSAGFALAALLLAAIGIYGVLAYLVAQRRREIGVRIALGSDAPRVFNMIMREGVVIVLSGVVVGLGGAWLLRGGIESQLYGVEPMNPLVVSGVTLVLAIVALAACAIPARRATRVDPVIALQQE
jgi:predicted permease